ncbi:MAG: UvrB/UvrC motif-containing protein [Chlamydiia bacterium]|nr:UvrB/UvrC motif-containing protein [Chlamydiia bacterium]
MAKKPSKGKDYPTEDRPLECSSCRKAIAVRYTEVSGGVTQHTIMCADCPQLEKRLHGIPLYDEKEGRGDAGLCCGNCGTTLAHIRTGGFLGCSVCYDVFGDLLLGELEAMHKVSPRLSLAKQGMPIHVGRAPGEVKKLSPSARLVALNEALTESLGREDYEQAALLRDQIKELEQSDYE